LQSTWGGNDLRRSILACGLLLAFAGMATAAAAAGLRTGEDSSTQRSSTTTSATTSTTTSTTVGSTTDAAKAPSRWQLRAASAWRRHIRRFRADTRHWLTVMHGRPPADVPRSLAVHSPARLRQLARRWRHRAHRVWWHAKHPPELRDWLCIHRYEGSWTDSGSPYWGGLQMNLSFQESYGNWLLHHKGTAEHWSPLEQIWVAVRASRVRGFSPWPATARYCGVY
jgi:hypothetical protein